MAKYAFTPMGAPSNRLGTGPEMMDTLPTVTDFDVTPVVEACWAGVGARAGVQVPDDVIAAPTGAAAASRAPPPATSAPGEQRPPQQAPEDPGRGTASPAPGRLGRAQVPHCHPFSCSASSPGASPEGR